MPEESLLEKTNRINLLYDFYHELLTDKQCTFMTCYFHDNYSLGEISEEFQISRQAVYEHIKRAEHALEEYERKLMLLAKHHTRRENLLGLSEEINQLTDERKQSLQSKVQQIIDMD